MKAGRSLTELATELERQVTTRKDYIAEQGAIKVAAYDVAAGVEGKADVTLTGINGGAYKLTDHAHGQLASHLEIPKKYYDRMRVEAPALLADNVNTWFQKAPKNKRTVRTLDGKVRAYLSSSYRPLDNHDLAEVALPTLLEKGCEIVSAQLTETRLYIKATLPSIRREVAESRQKGDVVQAGIVISNSEVGAGSVRIEPMIYRLVCLNGAIMPDSSLRKYHVGKGADVDGVRELLTTEAKRADDRAFWLKVRDIVRGAFDEVAFGLMVDKMNQAAGLKIVSDNLPKVVEVTVEKFGFHEKAQGSILRHLIEDGDLSKYGLHNAITRASQDVVDYDAATEMERAGGRILELPASDWKTISEAA